MSLTEAKHALSYFERSIRFRFAGAHIQELETLPGIDAWQLTAVPRFLEIFYIDRREDESLRILFVQFSSGMQQGGQQSETDPQAVFQKINASLSKNFRATDLMMDLSDFAREQNRIVKATCLLFRSDDGEEPLSEEDRKAAGLAGIPLDKLAGSDEEGNLVARVLCGGLPPLMLVHEGEFSFPARSWYPAGLIPDWQPWKQNVEYSIGDRLILHMDLPGTQSSLKEFHDRLRQGLSLEDAPVATVEITVSEDPLA